MKIGAVEGLFYLKVKFIVFSTFINQFQQNLVKEMSPPQKKDCMIVSFVYIDAATATL